VHFVALVIYNLFFFFFFPVNTILSPPSMIYRS
jgi:hypothetical protein